MRLRFKRKSLPTPVDGTSPILHVAAPKPVGAALFRDLTVLKNIVVGLLAAWGLTQLANAWSLWSNYLFYKRLVANDFAADEDIMAIATSMDNISSIVLWTSIGLFVLIVVSFCVWTYQAARNAKALSALPQRMSPGWTVGWYFVPFANFWKPFQGMREIWWRSAWPQKKRAPLILNIWWILWITIGILDKAVGRSFNTDNLEILAITSAVGAVMSLLWLLPTLLLIWIVIRVTQMQIARRAANPETPADSWMLPADAPSGTESAV